MQTKTVSLPLQNSFPPEFQLLTALVGQALGHPPLPVPRLKSAEWERFPALTAAHRVQPLAYKSLKTLTETVPEDVMARMKAEAERCWIHSTMLSQELGRVSRLLADADIPMVALKGPVLGVQAYGSGTARTMRDLDVLIFPADFARARAVLEAGGFVWEDPVSRLPSASQDTYIHHTVHLNFRHVRLGYLLEIHTRTFVSATLLPISVRELIGAAEPALLNGVAVPALSPWHHFLFVAVHGAKHGWWRLHWLADFAAFQSRYPEWFCSLKSDTSTENQDRWKTAERLGLARILASTFRVSHLCFGTPIPAVSFPASEKAIQRIVSFGVCSLTRGQAPATLGEKRAEMHNYLRIRSGTGYLRDVFGFYWHITQDDLVRFPLPVRLMFLYPLLRPWLWLHRKLMPNPSNSA